MKKLIILLCLLSTTLSSTTYYVATTGNDSNDGSISTPWLTPQHAVDNVSAGDTIFIRAGTYTSTSRIVITASGTHANPIVLSGYPNEVAILDGGSITGFNAILEMGSTRHHWVIQDLTIQNAPLYGIWLRGEHHTVQNCIIKDNTTGNGQGLIAVGVDTLWVMHNTITNVTWNALNFESCDQVYVIANEIVTNTLHAGINAFTQTTEDPQFMNSGLHIFNNLIQNNKTGIYIRYQQDFMISGNFILDSVDNGIHIDDHPTIGPWIHDTQNSLIAYNSIWDNGQWGIRSDAGYNLEFKRNSIKGNTSGGMYIADSAWVSWDVDSNYYHGQNPHIRIMDTTYTLSAFTTRWNMAQNSSSDSVFVAAIHSYPYPIVDMSDTTFSIPNSVKDNTVWRFLTNDTTGGIEQ